MIKYLLFFLIKKGAKKSRLYLFRLKIGFPSHSRPEPLLRRSLIALLQILQSHFLNAKSNKAEPKAAEYQSVKKQIPNFHS